MWRIIVQKMSSHLISGASRDICHLCCDFAITPSLACPASLPSFRAPSLGREAAGMASLSLQGWRPSHIRPNAVPHTHTHSQKNTLAKGSFCTLSFNQALRWASVTALSARRVKDLSPRVTSPTDPFTDRPPAHLAPHVTAASTRPEKSV